MNGEQAPKPAPELIWRLIDDSAVVVAPQVGKVRVFNAVGSVIWQLLVEEYHPAEIEAYLVKAYGISSEQASHDLQCFLVDLTDRGLLVWE